MGIKTIMQARKVLVVANGKAKAQAVKDAVTGPVTPCLPPAASCSCIRTASLWQTRKH